VYFSALAVMGNSVLQKALVSLKAAPANTDD